MIKKIFIALAIVVAAIAAFASTRPSEFKVSRSAVIATPPAVVFDQVNDLHKWQAWSPWSKLDPNAAETFEGSPAGTGAKMSWAGNHEVGVGSMTITESRPNELVRFRLEFLKPFKAVNTSEFTFAPAGDGTAVTWSMNGHANFISKVMSLFMNCEKMVGEQFEKGFANLKSIVEAR